MMMTANNKMELVTADAMSYFRALSEDSELPGGERKFASGFRDVLKKVTELGRSRIVRQYYDSKAMADSKRETYLVSIGSSESFKEKFEKDLNGSIEFAREIDGLYSEVNRLTREFVEAGGADEAALKHLDTATVALDMAEVAWEIDLTDKTGIYQHIKPGVPLDERIASGVKSSWPQAKEPLEAYKSGLPEKIAAKNALIAAGLETAGQNVAKDTLELIIEKYGREKKEELAGYIGGLVQNFGRLGAISYGAEQ